MARSLEDPLYVAWCTHRAARYAAENWHYTACLPVGKLVKIGVWEHGSFRGALVYGRGASPPMYKSWGFDQTELCELVRIALRSHEAPVSQLISISLKLLARKCPRMRLVASFADAGQGHHGGIYQAANWYYLGHTGHQRRVLLHGEPHHPRSVGAKYGTTELTWLREHVDPNADGVMTPPKLRYAYPLDDALRPYLEERSHPYPGPGSVDGVSGNTPSVQEGAPGSTPRSTHSLEEGP